MANKPASAAARSKYNPRQYSQKKANKTTGLLVAIGLVVLIAVLAIVTIPAFKDQATLQNNVSEAEASAFKQESDLAKVQGANSSTLDDILGQTKLADQAIPFAAATDTNLLQFRILDLLDASAKQVGMAHDKWAVQVAPAGTPASLIHIQVQTTFTGDPSVFQAFMNSLAQKNQMVTVETLSASGNLNAAAAANSYIVKFSLWYTTSAPVGASKQPADPAAKDPGPDPINAGGAPTTTAAK